MARIECALLLLIVLVGAVTLCAGVTDQEFQSVTSELRGEILRLEHIINALSQKGRKIGCNCDNSEPQENPQDFAQNATIEERVTLLEAQVTDLYSNDAAFEEDVNFLFDEQVIQDERLFELEQDADEVTDELIQINENIEDLQGTTVALDFRVTVLEENAGGGGGNSSVAELEERVETLEGTAVEHESEITDLSTVTGEIETRLTAAEENIEGLQTTDVLFDERITSLEENGGGNNNQNGTVAFHAELISYDTISAFRPVIFNEVYLNEDNGYNNATGVFTVPSGGDGFYYFSTELLVNPNEYGRFYISVNGVQVCLGLGDASDNAEFRRVSCSAVVSLEGGDEVQVTYHGGEDTTPLYTNTCCVYNVFSGFRI